MDGFVESFRSWNHSMFSWSVYRQIGKTRNNAYQQLCIGSWLYLGNLFCSFKRNSLVLFEVCTFHSCRQIFHWLYHWPLLQLNSALQYIFSIFSSHSPRNKPSRNGRTIQHILRGALQIWLLSRLLLRNRLAKC